MHNSVVFYRKPHNFSFYPIIHKKVLIFGKKVAPARRTAFLYCLSQFIVRCIPDRAKRRASP